MAISELTLRLAALLDGPPASDPHADDIPIVIDLFEPAVATRYRESILEQGGRRDAADLVEDFLGRPFGFEAFADWLSA